MNGIQFKVQPFCVCGFGLKLEMAVSVLYDGPGYSFRRSILANARSYLLDTFLGTASLLNVGLTNGSRKAFSSVSFLFL